MTNTNLLQAMGHIDPKLIADAAPNAEQKKSVNKMWVKWASLAACLCIVVLGALTINNNLHRKSQKPLAGIFEGEVIAIVDSNQCIVEVIVGDHNLLEGATAYVVYEKIVYNSEIYSEGLIVGNTVVVTYNYAQLKKENQKVVITIENIELADKVKPTE